MPTGYNYNTGISPDMQSGMDIGEGRYSNPLYYMREARMQELYGRYDIDSDGQTSDGVNPNIQYQDIAGLSPEDSQTVGKIAAGLSGNSNYMVPTNQFAQVLLNNKTLFGAAQDWMGNFAKALQAPTQPTPQQQSQMDLNAAKEYALEHPQTKIGGGASQEPWAKEYYADPNIKVLPRMQQIYEKAYKAANKDNPTDADFQDMLTAQMEANNPWSIRMNAKQPDLKGLVNWITQNGQTAPQWAQDVAWGKLQESPQLLKDQFTAVQDKMYAADQYAQNFRQAKINEAVSGYNVDAATASSRLTDFHKLYTLPPPTAPILNNQGKQGQSPAQGQQQGQPQGNTIKPRPLSSDQVNTLTAAMNSTATAAADKQAIMLILNKNKALQNGQ